MSGRWYSKRERRPLQQLQLAPSNYEQHRVRTVPKWMAAPTQQTPTKQYTLDRFFGPPSMARKSTQPSSKKRKRRTQNTQNEPVQNDEESVLSSKKGIKESQEGSTREKRHSMKTKRTMNQLELSPTPRSPVIQPGTGSRIPKYSLPVAESPPLPPRGLRKSPPLETASRPTFSPTLSIGLSLSQHQLQKGSPSPSYYTALSSPFHFTQTPSPEKESAMDGDDDAIVGKADPINEVPSSIPWENTPPEGWGDAWPGTQPTSPTGRSQSKFSQSSSGQFNDGFRVPDPPSVRKTSATSQNESQKSRTCSQASPPLRNAARNPFALFGPHHFSRTAIEGSQDRTQTEESYVQVDNDETQSQEDCVEPFPAAQKRKRVASIFETTDSQPLDDPMTDDVETPKKPKPYFDPSSDSLQELTESQIPDSMRKRPAKLINVHTTQSQTQEWKLPPRPSPTSQDPSKPFNLDRQTSSTSSDEGMPAHHWNSTQVTVSPLGSQLDPSSLVSPPPETLGSQIDPSNTKEPLALTLAARYPLESEADRLQNLVELEGKVWKEFQENEERISRTPKPRRK